MKRGKKRPRSFRAISRRVIALGLGMWFFCMGLLTWAAAADVYRQLDGQACWLVSSFAGREFRGDTYPAGLPGELETNMIRHLADPYLFLDIEPLLPMVPLRSPFNADDLPIEYGIQNAVLFADENGEVLMQSGNYLTFVYTTEGNWESENTAPLGRAYVDLNAMEGGGEALRLDFPYGFQASILLPVLRLTGSFDGNAFRPTAIDRGIYNGSGDAGVEQLNRLDQEKELEWENLYTTEAAAGRELETIYAWEAVGVKNDSDKVSVKGTNFDSLAALLRADLDPQTSYSRKSLLDAVIIWRGNLEDSYGAYTYSLAVQCQPLRYAMERLWAFYLVSAAATGLCVYLILRGIRYSLTIPLERMVDASARGTSVFATAPWAEPYALEKHFDASRKSLAEASAQLQQLRTALDYAKDAEEKRKQLVSNITHELKTPLAVIHSYAEGLQAGIAKEKTETYLSVILEETERMDSMVLQMLDLSRLEAGKVRLAADSFSLLRLTQSIAEKFAPMLQGKNLQLLFGQTEDFLITADEARIGQVVTNLMSNALKYTPEHGRIYIKIYTRRREACFSIVNTAGPLPEEALQKVWDSFYRVDPSRTEPGTGLGLTLVKSIVELHQGTCYVRNTARKEEGGTESGVEFGFTLPLG